jgi:hypothetical protein
LIRRDANRDARIGWIAAKQSLPIGTSRLTKPSILQVERVSQPGNDFGFVELSLK